jgi:putative restriction endonuclease
VGQISLRVAIIPTETLAEHSQPLGGKIDRYRMSFPRIDIVSFVPSTNSEMAFRRAVMHAYDGRCAVTGWKLVNGGGRLEAQAAHIRPVEHGGPDSVRNGLALSGTAHWMFDRGLIGLTDDLDIMVSRQVNDPSSVEGIINKTGRALTPLRETDRPHPQFLSWHREHCFKH